MRRDMPELWLWWTGTWSGVLMGAWCGIAVATWTAWEDTSVPDRTVRSVLEGAALLSLWFGLPIGAVAGLVIGAIWGMVAVLAVACVPRWVPAGVGATLVVAVVLGLLLALCTPLGRDGLVVAAVIGGFGVGPLALASFLVLNDRRDGVVA